MVTDIVQIILVVYGGYLIVWPDVLSDEFWPCLLRGTLLCTIAILMN